MTLEGKLRNEVWRLRALKKTSLETSKRINENPLKTRQDLQNFETDLRASLLEIHELKESLFYTKTLRTLLKLDDIETSEL